MLFAKDAWLSEMLGKPAFAVRIDECASRGVKGAELWKAMGEGPYFAFGKAASGSPGIGWAEANGFKLIEKYLVFEKPAAGGTRALADGFEFRAARASDEEPLARLAAETFRDDRFHSDPQVGEETASRMKAQWVRNYFNGKRGDGMIVAERSGKPVGFLQYLRSGEVLVIDLIAVEGSCGRRGVAQGLVRAAEEANPGCRTTRAGTQAGNRSALGFYEKTGFRLASSGHTYHRHHPEAA